MFRGDIEHGFRSNAGSVTILGIVEDRLNKVYIVRGTQASSRVQ